MAPKKPAAKSTTALAPFQEKLAQYAKKTVATVAAVGGGTFISFKGGVITFEGAGVDCTVRNMSDGGAALDVASGTMLPAHFRLSIKTDGFVARCRMIWNDGCRVGIAFD